jgi:Animal haem peroxidase
MTERHGNRLRGLENTSRSRLLSGRFGRLFHGLPAASFGDTADENRKNLAKLGHAMSARFEAPKDGPDPEESDLPALYTYFGQFVDHDLTFDPASSLQKQNDPDALVDYRTPAFDLDNVYGRGPDDQPYMYELGPHPTRFLLGKREDRSHWDLPRAANGRAIIGDPRNDENAIVSQLHGLFLQFHNRIARDHPTLRMEQLQTLTRFHYQYVVLNDFLPRIVHSQVLEDLKTDGRYDGNKIRFFKWRNEPFMPVEFSVAAYRLGHSMVRPGYRLNDDVILPIFPVPHHDLMVGLTGFGALKENRQLDWGRFIDVGDPRPNDGGAPEKKNRLQFAYRIDTSLVNPLQFLPGDVVPDAPRSLAERNLLRGWALGLPSGQQVANAMELDALEDRQILIGKSGGKALPINDPELGLGHVFHGNCPLWTYILAEAMVSQERVKIPVEGEEEIATPRLGPVGGRIVAEVFLGLMFGDPASLLRVNAGWKPPHHQERDRYRLRDFVCYALGR